MILHFWFLCLFAGALAQCPPNSLHLEINDTVCYSFHSTLSKFAFAQTHCKSFGAQLVSLKSEYINHYITGFANLIFDDIVFFWTGGNRLHNPNQLEWSNGEKLEYTHFPKGEESKNGSCLTADVKQGFWKVENCFAELSYICEFPAGKNIIPDKADHLDLDSTTDKPNGGSDATLLPPSRTSKTYSTKSSTKLPTVSTTPSSTKHTISTTSKSTVGRTTSSKSTKAPNTKSTSIPNTKSTSVPNTKRTSIPNTKSTYVPTTKSTSTITSRATSKVTPPASVINRVCPEGYQRHIETNQCYKFNKEKLMWHDAEAFCVKEGGHLTSIENEAENKFIVEFVTNQDSPKSCVESDQPWIGFSRLNKVFGYVWIDGNESNYTNWATLHSQPNNLNGNQSCVEIFTSSVCKFAVGSWNDLSCTLNHTSVCKQPGKDYSTPSPSYICPVGWKHRSANNFCYILNPKLTTWEDAEAFCQMEDAHLASICDEKENNFITNFIRLENSNNTCNTSLQTWIGLSKLADNTSWGWIDGNKSNFTKWSKNNHEPNNLHGNQFCVQMITDSGCQFKSGDWNDIECNTTQKAVCKKVASFIVNSTPESLTKNLQDTENSTNSDSPCVFGWNYSNFTGNCYKVNQNELKWADAESACRKDNAHLVSIEDKTENKFVVELVQKYYNHEKCERVYQLWIGYSRLSNDDNTTYAWANESSSSNYTNWAHRQPDDRKGKEACAHIITGSKCIFKIGLWNDLSCQNTRFSVCEKSADSSFDEFNNTTPKNDLIIEQLSKS